MITESAKTYWRVNPLPHRKCAVCGTEIGPGPVVTIFDVAVKPPDQRDIALHPECADVRRGEVLMEKVQVCANCRRHIYDQKMTDVCESCADSGAALFGNNFDLIARDGGFFYQPMDKPVLNLAAELGWDIYLVGRGKTMTIWQVGPVRVATGHDSPIWEEAVGADEFSLLLEEEEVTFPFLH